MPPAHEVKKFIIIFYVVGIAGFVIPYTQQLFIALIPFALLLNLFLFGWFHHPKTTKSFAIMLVVVLLGFFAEVIGVKTGLLFGHYEYGKALGPKVLEVPLLIGINWLILTYCAAVALHQYIKNRALITLLGAAIITLFDFFMEPVAIFTGMWQWDTTNVPLQNYLMWFILAALFVGLFTTTSPKNKNPLALWIFAAQFIFFLVLNLVITQIYL